MEDDLKLIIPDKYKYTYNLLLKLIANYDKLHIDLNTINKCWFIFQSALACNEFKYYDKADNYIKYINNKFKDIIIEEKDINTEFLIIPEKYNQLYNILLNKLSDYGCYLINKCNIECNNNIELLWNMFKTACVLNKKQGTEYVKQIIDYIENTINNIYIQK